MSDLSNITINDEPQTWQQLYEREKAQRQYADEFRRLVSDLSRRQHGRHEGDMCSECGGPSKGNPHARPGTTLGYDISGRPYTVPERAQFAKMDDWRAVEGGQDGE